MNRTIDDEQELLRAPDDLGMEPKTMDEFVQNIHLRQLEKGKRILLSHHQAPV